MVQILFLLFLGIARYDSEFETKENIIRTKDIIDKIAVNDIFLPSKRAKFVSSIFMYKYGQSFG